MERNWSSMGYVATTSLARSWALTSRGSSTVLVRLIRILMVVVITAGVIYRARQHNRKNYLQLFDTQKMSEGINVQRRHTYFAVHSSTGR